MIVPIRKRFTRLKCTAHLFYVVCVCSLFWLHFSTSWIPGGTFRLPYQEGYSSRRTSTTVSNQWLQCFTVYYQDVIGVSSFCQGSRGNSSAVLIYLCMLHILQFKMVSQYSRKPICARPHLSELFPVFPQKCPLSIKCYYFVDLTQGFQASFCWRLWKFTCMSKTTSVWH